MTTRRALQASRPRAVMGVTLQFDFGLSASDQNLARLLPENARADSGWKSWTHVNRSSDNSPAREPFLVRKRAGRRIGGCRIAQWRLPPTEPFQGRDLLCPLNVDSSRPVCATTGRSWKKLRTLQFFVPSTNIASRRKETFRVAQVNVAIQRIAAVRTSNPPCRLDL